MPDATDPKPWPFGDGQLPFAASQTVMPDWYARQYLQMTSMSLDLAGAWLNGTRRLTDAWRTAMRRQQDVLMNGLHQQLDGHLASPGAAEDRRAGEPAPRRSPRGRPSHPAA